jgi:hypothetical protein
VLAFQIIYYLFVASFITFVFTVFLRSKGPWKNAWSFFAVVLLSVLVAGMLTDFDQPAGRYTFWLWPFTSGLIMALLLAATTRRLKPMNEEQHKKWTKLNIQRIAPVLNGLFWLAVLLLLTLFIMGLMAKLNFVN